MKRYDIILNGMLTTLQLTDEDAAARGLLQPAPAKTVEPKPVPTKAKAPANKARKPANKQNTEA